MRFPNVISGSNKDPNNKKDTYTDYFMHLNNKILNRPNCVHMNSYLVK